MAAYQKNDFAASLRLLRPLAEKGDARAQYLVGRQYQFGQGVKVDRAEAFYWYRRAETKGHLEAKLFRQLLDKRWKITADEKGRAEKKLAAGNAPKPLPHVAEAEPKPRHVKPAYETAAVKEKPKAVPAKPAIETARAKLPESPKPEFVKAKPEPVKAKTETASVKTTAPPEKSTTIAARETPGTEEGPSVLRGKTGVARVPRSAVREIDDDDDGPSTYRNGSPPPETRTAVAATPSPPTSLPPSSPPPTSGDEYASAPPSPPPPYAPSPPYYGPAPYYAPGAPPGYYAPRPYFRAGWAYRPYAGYMHPGWRGYPGRGWRGRW